MSGFLYKVESGKDKQTIKPNTWTFIRIEQRQRFRTSTSGSFNIWGIIRIEYPARWKGTRVRLRLVRDPDGVPDQTGHTTLNATGFDGSAEHAHFCHELSMTANNPIGWLIWHDGKKPIVLDGRQLKARP